MQDMKKYTKFYKYSNNSVDIKNLAKNLETQLGDTMTPMLAIQQVCRYIKIRSLDWTKIPPSAFYPARTLIDARFQKSSELIKKPMASCGAQATLAASILRNMGYPVRLVHGDYPKADKHAWNEIWLKAEKKWKAFDCSSGRGKYFEITDKHVRELDCADWCEISDLIRLQSDEIQRYKVNARKRQ